jgi:hypothetical protein
MVATTSDAIHSDCFEGSFVKKLLYTVLLCTPLSAFAAGHLDVIKFELVEGCSFAEHQAITDDFNEWGADHGYRARVASPIQDTDLNSYYWLGESANAATYGAAWDAWRDSMSDPESTPAKLAARFAECSKELSRSGYDLH